MSFSLTSRRGQAELMTLLIGMLGSLGAGSGQTFYVDSVSGADTAGNGTKPSRPFATVNFAVGQCTANSGDTVIVLEGHTETVTTSASGSSLAGAGELNFGVAGVRVIGLGNPGTAPVFNFTTSTGANARVNATGVLLQNLRFHGGIDALTTVLVINGVADVTLRNIVYRDVTGQCTKFLHAANNSDRLTISGFRHIGDSAAGSTHSCTFDGCDDLIFENFHITGNFSTAAVGFITTASARITVRAAGGQPSQVWNQNSADVCFVDTITGSTGNFHGPIHLRLTDNAANVTEAITGATFSLFDDILVCNLAGEKAMLINTTATTDA